MQILTAFGRGVSQRAPDKINVLTTSGSAAITAKKMTGMGTLAMLGSAPLCSNRLTVFKRLRCLVKHNIH